MRHGNEEVAADAPAQVTDAVKELREVGVQSGGQDLIDAGVLKVGLKTARAKCARPPMR